MIKRIYNLVKDTILPFEMRWETINECLPLDKLPPEASLQVWLPAIFNQLQEGSCSANSGCTCMEILAKKFWHEDVRLSRAFLYQAERILNNTLYQDDGARLRNTQQVLMDTGVCLAKDDPYTPQDFVVEFTPALLQEAEQYRIHTGFWAPTLLEILNALNDGFPVQVGIFVYPSFESESVAQTGTVPMPSAEDLAHGPLGGHAVTAYGYDIPNQLVLLANSWGDQWGNAGKFTLPFAYFESDQTFMSSRVYEL